MGAARILDVFERGLRLHDPEIGIAGGAACDDADGRTLGERSDRAERAHTDADIRCPRSPPAGFRRYLACTTPRVRRRIWHRLRCGFRARSGMSPSYRTDRRPVSFCPQFGPRPRPCLANTTANVTITARIRVIRACLTRRSSPRQFAPVPARAGDPRPGIYETPPACCRPRRNHRA